MASAAKKNILQFCGALNKATPLRNPKVRIALIVLSIICTIVGVCLIIYSIDVDTQRLIHDYTDCKNVEGKVCANVLRNTPGGTCVCYQRFNITTSIKKQVFMSYALSGYDNMLNDKYFNSRDENQLQGNLSPTPSDKCGTYTYTQAGKPIAPCGANANFKFNDVITLQWGTEDVPMIFTGLVTEWERSKYKNPPGDLQTAFANFAKPINWTMNVWELNDNSTENNGFENEAFIIWMERALRNDVNLMDSLPLYARLDHTKDGFADGLHKGSYLLSVIYKYAVPENGRKSIVLWSTEHTKSHAKLAFGIIFLLVGVGCGVLFLMGLFTKKEEELKQDKGKEEEESQLNQGDSEDVRKSYMYAAAHSD